MITAKEAKENALKVNVGKKLPDYICSALVKIELESKRGEYYAELLDIVYDERTVSYFEELGFEVGATMTGKTVVYW